ncbi:MAG: altronate dehydratase family protein [Lentisphaeria bacterium]|nr:altronate dehydratase family protein [Lentisphaeria bacterium]
MIIHPNDNVEVREDGHKYARRTSAKGENVIKYGMPIGHTTCEIAKGEHVHTHNVTTNLTGRLEYEYAPEFANVQINCDRTFLGYRRADGQVGIRNHIWIIPTVGCVNALARQLADECGGIALTHPYGGSQLGDDHEMTANLLAAMVRNPNAGGVLVVGLGCENNTMESFKKRLGDTSLLNIRFLVAQDVADEIAEGRRLVAELIANRPSRRSEVPVSELCIGLKCGGSDGFSGLTANPLVGRISDWLVGQGGSAVLTEVPEMFGAETLLMKRCINREIFDKCVTMINDFKDYFLRHGQPVGENPSPGNKAGGITTLEDKSLGCVQKGGLSPVSDVLKYGERVKTHGLTLLSAPGNDMVSSTALAAAGCQMILFTTGRGTPFGTVVPTIKIATNSALAEKKPQWIDWDAMRQHDTTELVDAILGIASGEQNAKNEANHCQEVAIFKDGVTL